MGLSAILPGLAAGGKAIYRGMFGKSKNVLPEARTAMEILHMPSSKGDVPVMLPSQMTKDGWLSNIITNISSGSFLGGGRIQKFLERQQQMLKEETDRIITRYGKVPSPEVMGRELMGALTTLRDTITQDAPGVLSHYAANTPVADVAKRVVTRPSDFALEGPVGATKADTEAITESAQTLLNRVREFKTEGYGKLSALLTKLSQRVTMGENPETGELVKKVIPLKPTEVTVVRNQLDSLITEWSHDVSPKAQEALAAARHIRETIATTIGTEASTHTGAEAFAPELVRQVQRNYATVIGKDLEKWPAEALSMLRTHATPAQRSLLDDYFLSRVVRHPEDAVGATGAAKSTTEIADYTAKNLDRLTAALGDDAMAKLTQYRAHLATSDFDTVVKLIADGKAAPSELIAQAAAGNMPIETLRSVITRLPLQTRQTIETATLQHILSPAMDAGEKVVSANAISAAKAKLGGKLDALISPEARRALDTVHTALRVVDNQGSGIGKMMIQLTQGRAVIRGLQGVAAGVSVGAGEGSDHSRLGLGIAGAVLLGPALLARMITNPSVRRELLITLAPSQLQHLKAAGLQLGPKALLFLYRDMQQHPKDYTSAAKTPTPQTP